MSEEGPASRKLKWWPFYTSQALNRPSLVGWMDVKVFPLIVDGYKLMKIKEKSIVIPIIVGVPNNQ
jgi:hypothetical protein